MTCTATAAEEAARSDPRAPSSVHSNARPSESRQQPHSPLGCTHIGVADIVAQHVRMLRGVVQLRPVQVQGRVHLEEGEIFTRAEPGSVCAAAASFERLGLTSSQPGPAALTCKALAALHDEDCRELLEPDVGLPLLVAIAVDLARVQDDRRVLSDPTPKSVRSCASVCLQAW